MESKIKGIMEDVDGLRDRFLDLFLKNPRPLTGVASEMGIGRATLYRFMNADGPLLFTTVCKIKNYVEKYESK